MVRHDKWLEEERFRHIIRPYRAPAVVKTQPMCVLCKGSGELLLRLWPDVEFVKCEDCEGTGVGGDGSAGAAPASDPW